MSWNGIIATATLILCSVVSMVGQDLVYASDNFVRDLIESLADQSALLNVSAVPGSTESMVASVIPSLENSTQKLRNSGQDSGDRSDAVRPSTGAIRQAEQRTQHEILLPGASSVDIISNSLMKLASVSPTFDQNANSLSVLDSHEKLGSFGKFATEPIDLYKHFLIEVDRAAYTVELSGFKENGEKSLLYSCKAGLGSPEYPTPRGTFYIIRIFDDKPLWIPPQDREWAFGQVPSRSVYGGHMMPFFSKYSALSNKRNEVVLDDEDVVAAPIKMVDAGAYRIHGTDSPMSIGSGQSHGCVRLLNKTVAQLADTLKMYVGTTTRGQNPNGVYINLAKPVKLVLR